MVDPGMIQSGIGLISGVLGLGKKRKSKAQIMMEQDQAEERKLKSGLLKEAMGFDQGEANTRTIEELQARSQHAFENANAQSIGDAARGGANLGGDTALQVARQRKINSITDPMRMQIAQMRAQEAQQNLSVKMDALSRIGPATNRYTEQEPQDNSDAFSAIAGGIDGIYGGIQKNKQKARLPGAVSSGAKLATFMLRR